MKNSCFIVYLLLSIFFSNAQINETFDGCDRNLLIAGGWGFSAYAVNANNAISVCSVRSGNLTNPSANVFFNTPSVSVSNTITVAFDHKVTNLSSSPSLELIAINQGTLAEQSLFSLTYTNTNTLSESFNSTLPNGSYKFEFRASGNGGASRSVVDNLSISGVTLNADGFIKNSKVYYLKTTNKIIIETDRYLDKSEVRIYTLLGQETPLLLTRLNQNTYAFETFGLKNGCYIIKLRSKGYKVIVH